MSHRCTIKKIKYRNLHVAVFIFIRSILTVINNSSSLYFLRIKTLLLSVFIVYNMNVCRYPVLFPPPKIYKYILGLLPCLDSVKNFKDYVGVRRNLQRNYFWRNFKSFLDRSKKCVFKNRIFYFTAFKPVLQNIYRVISHCKLTYNEHNVLYITCIFSVSIILWDCWNNKRVGWNVKII